jgi:hypothetical protein
MLCCIGSKTLLDAGEPQAVVWAYTGKEVDPTDAK